MRRETDMAGFAAVTVLLVMITAFFCAATVVSSTDICGRQLEEYYLEKERELTGAIRNLLCGEGLENSGVMLTHVVEADGSRSYTVTVHHGRIDDMDESDREMLLERLESLSFADEDCVFVSEFLLDR